MSVYTPCTPEQVEIWLKPVGLGTVCSLEPVLHGVQNSNYRLLTDRGEWVLTFYEQASPARVADDLGLMHALAGHGLPVPDPLPQPDGALFRWFLDKPAAILPWLPGQHEQDISCATVTQLGQTVAQLHELMATWKNGSAHAKGHEWRQWVFSELQPKLNPEELTIVLWANDVDRQWQADLSSLPRQMIHADLFRDNVLWQHGQISALLDFYEAGYEVRLFELAVIINEWCCRPDGQCDSDRADAFLHAYQQRLPLTGLELRCLQPMRVIAALRFYLSRRMASLQPQQDGVLQKDPAEFLRILQHLQA